MCIKNIVLMTEVNGADTGQANKVEQAKLVSVHVCVWGEGGTEGNSEVCRLK